jgi:hypothetical protein
MFGLFSTKKSGINFNVSDKIKVSDTRTLVTVGLETFLETFLIWSCNRPLDRSHVALLKSQILETGLNGVFTVATVDNQQYHIVDGQHRYVALQEIYESEVEFHGKIIADIYKVNDEGEILGLFKTANSSRPLTGLDTPKLMLINIVDALTKQYPQCIRDVNKTIYPYVTKKRIGELLLPLVNQYNLPLEKWIELINRVNSEFSESVPHIRKGDGMFMERAKKSGFYLGLDIKDSWLDSLKSLCDTV